MTQVGEAIARYHKLIESGPYIDLGWAQALQEQLKAAKLGGRAISPVLRPHFLSGRDYTAMAKAAETISSAMARVERIALCDCRRCWPVSSFFPPNGCSRRWTRILRRGRQRGSRYGAS